MRLLAFVVTLGFLAAAGFAGQALFQAVRGPLPAPAEAPQAAALGTPAETVVPAPAQPRDWPALFGERVIPEPQPPAPPPPPEPEPEPQPPTPPAPPITSLGFKLQGVVSDGTSRWAIISHPTGEQLVRVGDALGEVYTVQAIDEQGLWAVSDPEAEPQLLGFGE
ncbi:MAG: hypothetical protein QNJ09_01895 [Paracoccaceae bacterium]|nr:hypothetical protein [Paracoccaceae bacterium]